MNSSQHLTTFKLLINLKPVLKRFALIHLDDDFIKFLVDCLYNIVQGNVSLASTYVTKQQFKKFKTILSLICDKKVKLPPKRKLLATHQGLQLIKLIHNPIQNHFKKEHAQ